jgi:hypothetical protein
MSRAGSDYEAFLLRIWRLHREGALRLQLVLVSARSGQEWRFSSLAGLVDFLTRQLDEAPAEPAADGAGSQAGSGVTD